MKIVALIGAALLATGTFATAPADAQPRYGYGHGYDRHDRGWRDDRGWRGDRHGWRATGAGAVIAAGGVARVRAAAWCAECSAAITDRSGAASASGAKRLLRGAGLDRIARLRHSAPGSRADVVVANPVRS